VDWLRRCGPLADHPTGDLRVDAKPYVAHVARTGIHERKDPASRGSLETAYGKEVDETTKGRIKAAILEIDNPGKCVAEDEGRGTDGICRYVCRDQNTRARYPKDPKDKGPCPLVRDPDANATNPPVNSAAALAK